jgi:hypothetical protein
LRRQIAILPRFALFDQSDRVSAVTIIPRVHFRGITAACASITGEIITAVELAGSLLEYGLMQDVLGCPCGFYSPRAKMLGPR